MQEGLKAEEKKEAESTRTLENATCFFKWLGGNCSLEKFNALKQVFLKASDSAVYRNQLQDKTSSTVVLIR